MKLLTPTVMAKIAEQHLQNLGELEFYSDIHSIPEFGRFSICEVEPGRVILEEYNGEKPYNILKEFYATSLKNIDNWPQIIRESREIMGRYSEETIWVQLPFSLKSNGEEYQLEPSYDYFM